MESSCRFYYEVKKDHTVRLLRCFGETGEVVVPEKVGGLPVTAIGPYCFAENGHLSGKHFETEAHGEEALITEQCGRFVTSVVLPESVTAIDGYAFYNCRNLRELTLSSDAPEIGNDAFMNCIRLQNLNLIGSVAEKTSLKQMLAQITWNVEVSFYNMEGIRQCALFFPEYSEYYDLIGPAHIFELLVQGEGFRARNCFVEGVLKLQEYDGIFAKACAEEPEESLCRFALNRLLYPVDLGSEAEASYRNYLKDHGYTAAKGLLLEEHADLAGQHDRIGQMVQQKLLDAPTIENLIALAVEKDMPESAAYLMKCKRTYFTVSKKKRYEF